MKLPVIGFVLLILSFLFTACQKDQPLFLQESTESQVYAEVPVELWSYFQDFEDEAEQRGVLVDLSQMNISAEFEEIAEDGIAGTCTYGSHSPGHVVIDQGFWRVASDALKEMIVFHELGHCTLFLGHREGINRDGTCQSIMRSGLEDCRDNYHAGTRAAYLDELFRME